MSEHSQDERHRWVARALLMICRSFSASSGSWPIYRSSTVVAAVRMSSTGKTTSRLTASMDCDAALRFSRDRHDFPQSDIIRTNNQGLVILAGIAQMQKSAATAAGEFHLITLLYQHAQLMQ